MALISCPECDKQVSSVAIACPSCAYPLAATDTALSQPKTVVTTQSTSKYFKAIQLLGVVCILIGMVSCSSGSEHAHSAALWLIAGVVTYLQRISY
jgi:glycerol dehydrogenase-like iron-containing ADH family enzyme